MILRDAVIQVMSETNGPLGYREIWDRIERRGLYKSPGKTPWQSVGAVLYAEPGLFKKVERGKFMLGRGASLVRTETQVARRTVKQGIQGTRPGTLLDAVYRVVAGAKGQELHYREVWKRIKSGRLYRSAGKTPWQTVGSILYGNAAFRKTRPGFFVLSGLASGRQGKEKTTPSGGNWQEFEAEAADLMRSCGLSILPRKKDRGVDVWAEYRKNSGGPVRIAVQSKHWNRSSVGPGVVRELSGAIDNDDIGVLMTIGEFSKEALRVPQEKPRPRLILMDGDMLDKLRQMNREARLKWARERFE
jgi:hypothetical protein